MIPFEWDEEKDWSNFLKHGIFFEEAKLIWTDINAIEFIDEYHSQKEAIRIISARKADKFEKEHYERSLRLR